jgi:hypothetical protein
MEDRTWVFPLCFCTVLAVIGVAVLFGKDYVVNRTQQKQPLLPEWILWAIDASAKLIFWLVVLVILAAFVIAAVDLLHHSKN